MKIAFIKKQLVNGIDNINIPQKEQLLPAAAFEKSTNRKPRISCQTVQSKELRQGLRPGSLWQEF